jgi:tetratricopeptide (TPR) repeat protein
VTGHGDDSAAGLPASRRRRACALAAALIVLATLAVYAGSLHGPFVFDDPASIVDNPTIRDLRRLGTVLSPPGGMLAVEGRPVVNLSLAVNWALGREAVPGYHLFNVALHALTALVLFGLVRRTLLLPATAARFGDSATGLAAAVAILWAVHPLQAETVNVIVHRGEGMMALCYLGTLYAVVRSVTSAHPGRWHAAAVVACATGAGCKEVIVTAPLTTLLYDRIFLASSWREIARGRRWLYAGLLASWALLALLVNGFYESGGTGGMAQRLGPWQYLLLQPRNVLRYLGLSFWPHPLVLDYGMESPGPVATVLPAALAVAALLGATVWALRRAPRAGFLGAVFFLVLAPTTTILPLASQTTAEKRMYLPLAAVLALVVLGGAAAWRRPGAGHGAGWPRRAPLVAAVLATVVLGGLTVRRNHDYRSGVAIWSDTVAKRPDNSRAHYNLGRELALRRDAAGALAQFDRSLALDPGQPDTYRIRAFARFAQGRYAGAREDAAACQRLGGEMPAEFLDLLQRAPGAAPPADTGRADAAQSGVTSSSPASPRTP